MRTTAFYPEYFVEEPQVRHLDSLEMLRRTRHRQDLDNRLLVVRLVCTMCCVCVEVDVWQMKMSGRRIILKSKKVCCCSTETMVVSCRVKA